MTTGPIASRKFIVNNHALENGIGLISIVKHKSSFPFVNAIGMIQLRLRDIFTVSWSGWLRGTVVYGRWLKCMGVCRCVSDLLNKDIVLGSRKAAATEATEHG